MCELNVGEGVHALLVYAVYSLSKLCYRVDCLLKKHVFPADKWEQLQYPFTRTVVPGRIQDIQDGKLYRRLQQPGGFLSTPENTGFILCSDGVQLFKSSNQSFWPVLLAVTSLPPGIRMNAENLILAGVWQGSIKPPMEIILGPVIDKIQHLHSHGIQFQSPTGSKVMRAKLLIAVFDLPAKAMATNFVQYNGYYSCTYCLDKGQHRAYRHTFLPTEKHEPRTEALIKQHAIEAKRKGKAVFGIKGKSILSSCIKIVSDVPIDYMHAVLEGVSKSLLSAFLDSKYHNYRFYLGRTTEQIDQRMREIKPPQEFRRSPRSLTSMKQWKASEHRAWLLYYCLPVLGDLLPADYVYHLSLLVSALHILLGDAVQIEDVEEAQKLLEHFFKLLPQLYCTEMCSANMHSLLHLSQFVLDWGPLWCYSCFGFESMNGHLRKSCHGTRYVLPQLVHNMRMRQKLPQRGKEIANSATLSLASNFISSLSGAREESSELEIKSRITHKYLTDEVVDALRTASFLDRTSSPICFPTCNCIRYKSTVYSVANERNCRDGSICVFKDQTGLHFGSIIQFCFIKKEIIAILRVFDETSKAIFDNIGSPTIPELSIFLCKCITNYVYCVKKLTDANIFAIPVSSILVKCVHIPIRGTNYNYITTIPNMFEHH